MLVCDSASGISGAAVASVGKQTAMPITSVNR